MFQSETFTAIKTAYNVVEAGSGRVIVKSIIITADQDNADDTSIKFTLGAAQVFHHPGLPAGGSVVITGVRFVGALGGDLTLDSAACTVGWSYAIEYSLANA